MEKLFSTLAHPDRLWIVMYLAAEGPQRQKDLISALGKARPGRPTLSSGAMSNLVVRLVDAGVLQRDRRRGELRLAHPEQVGRLLVLASAISVATAGGSHQAAEDQHAQLMRALTQAHEGQIESPRG